MVTAATYRALLSILDKFVFTRPGVATAETLETRRVPTGLGEIPLGSEGLHMLRYVAAGKGRVATARGHMGS